MNNFLGGIAIGAGIAVGVGLVIGVGGAAWQAGSTYAAVQSANDPVDIEARNEARFTEIFGQVSTHRHDDVQRCMDRFEAEAGVSGSYPKDVSDCAAGYGWDRTDGSDLVQQYNRVMSAKVREEALGKIDRVWLDKKIAEYFK
jgi:hypothetical protein